jgi:hypothetical protein
MDALIVFSNPLGRPLHFLGLELVVLGCFVLTLRHAAGRFRAGERWPLFQWLAIFAYGVVIELVAFNYLQNYNHGQFSIQLYHDKLPLYVTAIYVVFHYTGLKLIERLALGALPEALLVGLMIFLLDVPFDLAGVDAGWWAWTGADPNMAVKWLGVPITSYYWYLTFGACYPLVLRAFRPWLERRSLGLYLACAPLAGVAILIAGTIAFLPFHGLKALGVPDGAIVALHVAGCAALALVHRRAFARRAERPFLWIAGALYGWHVVVLIALGARGEVPQLGAKAALVAVAAAGAAWLTAPRRVLVAAAPARAAGVSGRSG